MKRVPIEVDVTYVNKSWGSKRPKIDNSKHYVIGFYLRTEHGKAVIEAMPDNKPDTIREFVLNNIEKGNLLYCEQNILPPSLKDVFQIIELPVGKHTDGDVHLSHVKNMWKDLKRQIKREHVSVSQKHLQLYCDEVAWRINNRHLTPMEKFNLLLSNCAVKDGKTTYKNLIK